MYTFIDLYFLENIYMLISNKRSFKHHNPKSMGPFETPKYFMNSDPPLGFNHYYVKCHFQNFKFHIL